MSLKKSLLIISIFISLVNITLEGQDLYSIINSYIDKLLTSSPDMPLWNIESIKSGKKPKWNYIDGCMLSSLIELYHTTGNSKYINFVKSFVDYYVDSDGNMLGYNPENYSTDDISESRILFDLLEITGNQKYKKAIDKAYGQIQNHPRTSEGNFWHKKTYPNQVWLDGLYMAQVFYTRYQTNYQWNNYWDILNQFQNVYNIMFDKAAKLYYHGYDSSKNIFWADPSTGLSKNFWLRSIGWYTCALVDVYSYMNPSNTYERGIIANIFDETIKGILLYQDSNSKMFWQVVNYPGRQGNYLETSGSSMISYAILKAVRLGILSNTYRQVGIDIFNGICNRYLTVNSSGELNLGGICLSAGLGPADNTKRDGSYEYYISEDIVENDAKGVGPLIMAYTEMLKINN